MMRDRTAGPTSPMTTFNTAPPIEPADEGTAARPEPAPLPLTFEPLVRLYLLSVASGGFYLAYWAYRTGRRLERDPAARDRLIGWGALALFPPFACLLLFELARLAEAGLEEAGRRPRALAWRPAAILAV